MVRDYIVDGFSAWEHEDIIEFIGPLATDDYLVIWDIKRYAYWCGDISDNTDILPRNIMHEMSRRPQRSIDDMAASKYSVPIDIYSKAVATPFSKKVYDL